MERPLLPVHHGCPNITPPEIEPHILEHRVWGCDRLSAGLKLAGIQINTITVQKILNCNAMAAATTAG